MIAHPMFMHGGPFNSGGSIQFQTARGYRGAPNGFVCVLGTNDAANFGDTITVGGTNYLVCSSSVANGTRFYFAVHPTAVF